MIAVRCTPRRLLTSSCARRFQNSVVCVNVQKTSGLRCLSTCCFPGRSTLAPFVHVSSINSPRDQYRLPSLSLRLRDFSSLAEDSPKQGEESSPVVEEWERTVGEQIDPNKTVLPQNSWVQINYIPPTSTLGDLLNSVSKTLNDEYTTKGIIDFDGYWNPEAPPPMLSDLDVDNWVEAAYMVLNTHCRHSGWRVRFRNRSIAHCLIEAAKAKQFKFVWKDVEVQPWLGRDEELLSDLVALLSDAAIRVENCSQETTEAHCRHLFRRYDLAWDKPAVIPVDAKDFGFCGAPNSFIVRFADASWARAAIRELQGVDFRGSHLRLVQYAKQII